MSDQQILFIQEISLWRQRLEAIFALSAIFKDRYISRRIDRQDREATIDQILANLQEFGTQQFNFFCNGFRGKFVDLQLRKSTNDKLDATPQYVFSIILNQLADDLVVLQRALEQRIIPMLKDPGQQPDKITATLDMADKLAWAAKKMFEYDEKNQYLAEKSTVLSYLHKSPNVRMIPYSPVALIGIPVTSVDHEKNPLLIRDFLSIPHELGHHLYWYGKSVQPPNQFQFMRENLLEEISDCSLWLQNWAEEIFADVVGCLIGGPVVALSIQDLVLEERLSQFDIDYERHPLPILRPFIYTETLKRLDNIAEDVVQKLEERWKGKLAERKLPSPTFPESMNWTFLISDKQTGQSSDSQSPPSVINFSEVIKVIQTILRLLPIESLDAKLRWSYGKEINGDIERLYDEFRQRLPVIIQSVEIDTLNTEWTSKTWYDLVRDLQLIDETSTGATNAPEWLARLDQAAQSAYQSPTLAPDASESSISPEQWLSILKFRGWTTEGPGSPRGTGG